MARVMEYYNGRKIIVHKRRRLRSVYNVADRWNISPLDAAELMNNVESRQTNIEEDKERKEKEIEIIGRKTYYIHIYIVIEFTLIMWIYRKLNNYLTVNRC